MLSKFIASLLITFSVLLGTKWQGRQPNTEQKNSSDSSNLSQIESRINPREIIKDSVILKDFFEYSFQQKQNTPHKLPQIEEVVDWLNLKAKAAASFDTENNRFLFQKNIDQKLPIASLTKLLTALKVMDQLELEEIVEVSKKAIATYGEMGNLVVEEKISVKNLLYIMLIESSNDAAVALAEVVEKKTNRVPNLFVDLMNKKAKEIGLFNSHFSDASGLNLDNVSTISDLTKLTKYSLENQKYNLIWQILGIEEINVQSIDGKINHYLKNTNKLIGKIEGIVGGKTGYTEEAGECMILVIKNSSQKGYLINVILGAANGGRFTEMERLVKSIQEIYLW